MSEQLNPPCERQKHNMSDNCALCEGNTNELFRNCKTKWK